MFAIRLLGPPEIARDGQLLNVSRRKSRALVYYLAAQPRPITREQALLLLWPDLERTAAQQTLRTTLHGLRKALGEALAVEGELLALAPEVTVDARQFEAELNQAIPAGDEAALTRALALYRGDFLDGFGLSDSAAFDDWQNVQREHFRRLAIRGWSALGKVHEAGGQYGSALEALDHALAFDPLQEDLQRAALRLHYLAGDRAGAVRRYTHLVQLLEDEMGVPPMAETRTLYDAIVMDTLQPATPAGAGPAPRPPPSGAPRAAARVPFAGREAELQALSRLAGGEEQRLALVEGEPGIGKTRLAEEFLAASGRLVLAGRAREQEQNLPYQPIAEALRGLLAHPAWPAISAGMSASLPDLWLAEVARLLPELQPGGAPRPTADESRLWEGLHQFLLVLARQHPLGVFVDDLQWADASTLGLLNYLTRRAQADSAPILYLAAMRPPARGSAAAALVQTLTREDRLLRLPLTRLSFADLEAVARAWLAAQYPAADPAPLRGWLAHASEGNPYVLAELLRYAREHHLVRPDGQLDPEVLGTSPLVPHTIYALIQSRLARLSEPARRIIDAAVAAGREFEFEVVYRAAGLSEAEALDALDELRAAGLLHPLPEVGGRLRGRPALSRYAFDHSLTMEVAYREVGEPRHRRMHRRVAEALEQTYGRQRLDSIAGLLAVHFAEGQAPERAAPYARQAGRQAMQLAAWTEAVQFFELALEATQDLDERLNIFMALGEVHFRAGSPVRASEAFRSALALAQQSEETEAVEAAQYHLARTLLPQARFAEAIRLAQQLRAWSSTPQTTAAAEFLWGTALSLEGVDLNSATEHLQAADAAWRAALAAGTVDYARLAQVKFELGSVAAQQGDLPRAIALYQEALEHASRSSTEEGLAFQVLANNNLAYHLHLIDPADPAAVEHGQAGLRLAQEKGVLGLLPYLHSTLGEIALAQGDLAQAESHFEEGLTLAERSDLPERVAGLTANLGRLAHQRGEHSRAIYRLSTALAQANALGVHHLAAHIRLWLLPLLPPAEARVHLAEVRAFAESGGRQRLLDEAQRLEEELAAG